MNSTATFAASRRSPSRNQQHRGPRQYPWVQTSAAGRLMTESRLNRRPSTEPSLTDRDAWLCAYPGCPGITEDGRYLPSSKAKHEATSAALQRRRPMGGQKFHSNYSSNYDESVLVYGNQQVPITAWNQPYAPDFGGGGRERSYSLPDNVTLVTLEEIESGDILLRLAHLYEEGEHRELSKPAYIDIRNLFQGCQITGACEMDLSATQFKGNLQDLVIELGAMQVRTFLLTII